MKDSQSRDTRNFDEIKSRVLKQASEGTVEDISMLEYTQFMQNRQTLQMPHILIMLMTQFLKKLYRTEAIGNINEEEDDLFRPIHAENRKVIASIVRSRSEVSNAIRVLFD